MDTSLLAPSNLSIDKEKQIQDAKDMYQAVVRNAKGAVPPYDLLELIGKGGSGRVYKCKKQNTGELVAVKIVNVDDVDYDERACDREETLRSFRKEVAVLQQLKDSNAQNVNMIHEAFDLHNQLWIVSDYCTGGSVRTLMRANPPSHRGLEEHFIIVILRELTIALKSVHELGVIHRDLKCTNVYVSEEGRIQLGDFGVVGVFDDGASKRKTVIGTPHYMAQELHDARFPTSDGYTFKVDIWALGCTAYEMATGLPPYARIQDIDHIQNIIFEQPPRLEGDEHSKDLKDFIESCCQVDPDKRPTADELLKHPFIAGTSKKYPTSALVQLIERYTVWELRGGNRTSLWAGGGAAPPPGADDFMPENDGEDWNFSTSDSFNEDFTRRYSHMVAAQDFANGASRAALPLLNTQGTNSVQQYYQDISAGRGERSLERIWRPDEEYSFDEPRDDMGLGGSDLPFRDFAGSAATRESLIDLDSAGPSDSDGPTFNFDFGDVPTVRARASRLHESPDDEEEDEYEYPQYDTDERRATLAWTFPNTEPARNNRATLDWEFPLSEPQNENRNTLAWTFPPEGRIEEAASDAEGEMRASESDSEAGSTFHPPPLRHASTEPLDGFRDFRHPSEAFVMSSSSPVRDSLRSMIDLDAGLADPTDLVRPSTAGSVAGTEVSNQFDLEEDRGRSNSNRVSYHRPWESEGGSTHRSSHASIPMHSRGNSLTSSDSEMSRSRITPDGSFGYGSMDFNKNGEPNSAIDRFGAEHWPGFSSDSATEEEGSFPTIRARNDSLPTRTISTAAPVPHPLNGSLDIPVSDPPHPDAMVEDADHQLFVSEFSRLLDDCGASLEGLASGLQLLMGPAAPAPSPAPFMRSSDSSALSTDDEDAY